jgi:predicted acylesterase/phospholipase RssA
MENILDISLNILIESSQQDLSCNLLHNTIDLSHNTIDLSHNTIDLSNNTIDLSNNITCLCFSGGGVSGLAFISAIEKLIEMKKFKLENINCYVGTSAGAIIGYLLNIGIELSEIIEFIYQFNFSKLIGEINCITLLEDFGINNGDRIKLIFIKFLELKFNKSDITFKELYNITKKKLTIIGTNLSEYKEAVFNVDITPNFSVITALRISISIPVIFTPVSIDNILYVDGAIINNFPINHCPIDNTIGFHINYKPTPVSTFYNLILSCMSITMNSITTMYIKNNKNIIVVDNPENEITSFNITTIMIDNILKIGRKSVDKYLKIN